MKTRIIVIIILLLVLTVLLTRNDERIADTLLNIINPVKQNYKNFTQNIEDKSHSYIFQKESIEKLSKENRILRKRLLEQMHYIEEVQNIYTVLPQLSRLPSHSIDIAETISYVKLNSFSQIILTKPKKLENDKIYGLIQGTVVAGVAKQRSNQLYGFLTSDEKCRFSVFIGDKKAPGIAIGMQKHKMIVKFIPKWHKIKVGDKVVTSGLDNIFFANVPVGLVTKIEVQSAYTVAYIKTFSDILHPKTFFLIHNPNATLAEGFESNSTKFAINCPKEEDKNITQKSNVLNGIKQIENNQTLPIISSIPNRIDQTRDDIVEPETVPEVIAPVKKVIKKRKINRKKAASHSLDLF